MKVLVAEDCPVSRRTISRFVEGAGFEVTTAENGLEAREAFRKDPAIRIAILDWTMPHICGLELCKLIRAESIQYIYIMFLTSKNGAENVVAGLQAGADDYLEKPVNKFELTQRIRSGQRVIGLETELQNKVAELEESLAQIKRLEGILTICMHCKKIRNANLWKRIELYMSEHTDARFSHGICEECLEEHYPAEEEDTHVEDAA